MRCQGSMIRVEGGEKERGSEGEEESEIESESESVSESESESLDECVVDVVVVRRRWMGWLYPADVLSS